MIKKIFCFFLKFNVNFKMFVWFMNEKDLFIGFYLEGYILGVFYGLLFFFCSGFLEVFKGLDSLIIWFLNIYVIVFIVN